MKLDSHMNLLSNICEIFQILLILHSYQFFHCVRSSLTVGNWKQMATHWGGRCELHNNRQLQKVKGIESRTLQMGNYSTKWELFPLFRHGRHFLINQISWVTGPYLHYFKLCISTIGGSTEQLKKSRLNTPSALS